VGVRFTPSQVGDFEFSAVIAGESGEQSLANNSKRFPLQVNGDKIRVLYIEGFLRYEYKFLNDRFKDDPDIQVASVVRRTNPELTAASSGGDLLTAERLKNFDVVILGDMEATYLGESEYQALVRWVEQGHALLVLGGYRSFG